MAKIHTRIFVMRQITFTIVDRKPAGKRPAAVVHMDQSKMLLMNTNHHTT